MCDISAASEWWPVMGGAFGLIGIVVALLALANMLDLITVRSTADEQYERRLEEAQNSIDELTRMEPTTPELPAPSVRRILSGWQRASLEREQARRGAWPATYRSATIKGIFALGFIFAGFALQIIGAWPCQ